MSYENDKVLIGSRNLYSSLSVILPGTIIGSCCIIALIIVSSKVKLKTFQFSPEHLQKIVFVTF